MKSLFVAIGFLMLLSGCKELIAPYSGISANTGKKCTAVFYDGPDVLVNFDLIENNFNSMQIELNNEKLLNECTDYASQCTRPYFKTEKLDQNGLKISVYDSKYQKINELDVKLSLVKNDSSISVIESKNENLNWSDKELSNCNIYRSANLTINE